jgi:CheY-like chemotaxis protein
VRRATSKPLFAKLSPNVARIGDLARAVADAGADAITAVNTVLGLALDWRTRRPGLATVQGGYSGPAIKPIALRCAWECARAVSIPVIGCGGIATVDDVLEYLVAGCTAVQIGTAAFADPALPARLVAELESCLEAQGTASVRELVGTIHDGRELVAGRARGAGDGRRALEIYLQHAWPASSGREPPLRLADLEEASELETLLARFEQGAGGGELKRYTLRLGNSRYPFMKFVVQEHLVNGEYFFSVDTHDNLEVRPSSPDFVEWERLRAYNRALKAEIEAEWERTGLQTNTDLRALMEELARVEREEMKRRTILLVDDERDVALGLAALLRARGYGVELARDGLEALERLGREPLPDLVLLDYEMPQLDGEEVLRRLRREQRTAHLPVLLATAATIDLSRLRRVSGLLQKPYPRHVLFAMIARLLEGREGAAPLASEAPRAGAGPGPGAPDSE